MRTILTPPFFGTFLSLLLLCSCVTENSVPSRLPADVPINRDAGCGNLLQVTLRLESGEELQFVVDTGTGGTCFDTSMESKLGKPLGTVRFQQLGKFERKKVYATPKLYLEGAPLMTGSRILTMDLKHMPSFSDRPVMGILGMDVLEHYCIQLDFAAGRMRFLDGEDPNQHGWGKPFALTDVGNGCFSISENLTGAKGPGSMIDTGALYGGYVLDPASLAEMVDLSPSLPFNPHYPYGLGFEETTVAGHVAWGHRGHLDGFWAAMEYLPAYHVTIVLLTNADWTNPLTDTSTLAQGAIAGA